MRPYGGDEEDRTPDPLLAKQVLSQLSYTPIFGFPSVFQASHCGTVFFSTLKIEQCFLSTLRSPLLTEASELSFNPLITGKTSFKRDPASTCSPTPSPVQYHRPLRS